MQQHSSQEVQSAIIRLADALCSWERSTSIESVLIIREAGGFEYRAVGGKPNVPDDVSDIELFRIIGYESTE